MTRKHEKASRVILWTQFSVPEQDPNLYKNTRRTHNIFGSYEPDTSTLRPRMLGLSL